VVRGNGWREYDTAQAHRAASSPRVRDPLRQDGALPRCRDDLGIEWRHDGRECRGRISRLKAGPETARAAKANSRHARRGGRVHPWIRDQHSRVAYVPRRAVRTRVHVRRTTSRKPRSHAARRAVLDANEDVTSQGAPLFKKAWPRDTRHRRVRAAACGHRSSTRPATASSSKIRTAVAPT